MARLTDTQLIILSAASQRDDRAVELPANVKGEAARKVVGKLIRAGLLEEVRAGGSLPVWRRDDARAQRAALNVAAIFEAIAPSYLYGVDPDVLVFLDIEPKPQMTVEYYMGWSSTLQRFSARGIHVLTFEPNSKLAPVACQSPVLVSNRW
jgi:hypothetical protein